MSDKQEIRVKFEIGDIKFEAEGSAELVERERSIFNNTLLPAAVEAIVRTRNVNQREHFFDTEEDAMILPPVKHETQSNILEPDDDFSKISLVSFVKSKGADAHYYFIICAVYFNGKRTGEKTFSSTTIKELYSEAKKPLPNNLSMSLSELVKKGWIMEDISAKGQTPKQYVLTSDGEEMVKNMQPKESKPKKQTSRHKKAKAKEPSIYAGIDCDNLNLGNYPEVKLLKDFKDKMMLILYIVTNERKGEWFTTADVLCLMTDIFGEAATNKQVDGVFGRNKRWFKTENIDGNKRLVHRKLLNEGKIYAQSIGVTTE